MLSVARRREIMGSKTGIILIGLSLSASCTHGGATPVSGEVVHAYRAVRTGSAPATGAQNYQFCASHEGVRASLRDRGDEANWADKERDSWVAGRVKTALREDPRIDPRYIDVEVHKGMVRLVGHAPSDAAAAAAIEDALHVAGVVKVTAELTSPESERYTPRQASASSMCL